MRTTSIFFFIICFLAGNRVKSQSYYFYHHQVENGLSNNAVICSIQDQKGFLWFGTKDGLNRFDGYTYKTFRNDRDDSTSIGSNFIYCLYEDKNGVLWVGCDRGLFKYNATTESFSRVTIAPGSEILDIQMDNSGFLWFIAKMRLYRYDLKTGNLKRYNQRGPFAVTSVCTTGDGALWISTAAGFIGKFEPAVDSFKTYNIFKDSKELVPRWIEKIYDAGNGALFIGTSNDGAKNFDTRTGVCNDIHIYNTDKTAIFVRDFIHYSADEYWVATESGIFIYNIKSGKYVNLIKNLNDPYSISDNAIYTFCKDNEGGLWAGTYFGGVNYYPRQYTSFKKYFPQYGINSVSGNAIREICQDKKGNLWIGTEDAGLNKLETPTGRFTHFNSGNSKTNVSHSNIHGLLMNGDELWIGTFHHGLDVLNVKTGKVLSHYTAARHGLKSDFVSCLYKTSSGKIIAGTDRGLCYYNPLENNFTVVKEVPQTFYTTIYEDCYGTIWAGTYNEGIYYFNPGTKQKGKFRYAAADKNSLSGNRVNWVFEDSRRVLWIATEGGLCQLNREKGNFTNYTTKNGFPSNIIYTVLEDAKKNFWVSTSRGLVCFSPLTGSIKIYTKANGILNDQFNYNSAFKDSTGRMYFGSVKGMISFHPDEFIKNTFLPPVYITGFQLYDNELEINKNSSPLTRSITYTDNITLQHNQSSFSIDFAALSYTWPERTEYAYQLEGLEKDRTYHIKTNRRAYFTELAPGTYIFTVKASTVSGVWNSKPAVLTIKILPPLWKSTQAYLLYAIMVATVIFFMLRSYHRRIVEKNQRKLDILERKKEKEIYKAKIDFFTNVAHEIRTPLTLIKAPMEKVMKKAEEIPAIKRNLQIMQMNTDILLDLTTQLLDFRKTEINGFNLDFVNTDIAAVLRDNYVRFKPSADQKQLQFKIFASPPLFAFIDLETLNKILSNILNNAIKYSDSIVSIHLLPVATDDIFFTIEVKNDGYLIPVEMKEKIFETFFRIKETKKQLGTGLGLALSRSLAELHKGSLIFKGTEEDKNVFALTLPVHQTQLT
ncbi:MAG: hybrid sensor histidine kinase/response regulator [Ferruginibacter sp.]|nr:hybrid sensor histidine kinase/response regulator [Ferruginibacter sp.]